MDSAEDCAGAGSKGGTTISSSPTRSEGSTSELESPLPLHPSASTQGTEREVDRSACMVVGMIEAQCSARFDVCARARARERVCMGIPRRRRLGWRRRLVILICARTKMSLRCARTQQTRMRACERAPSEHPHTHSQHTRTHARAGTRTHTRTLTHARTHAHPPTHARTRARNTRGQGLHLASPHSAYTTLALEGQDRLCRSQPRLA